MVLHDGLSLSGVRLAQAPPARDEAAAAAVVNGTSVGSTKAILMKTLNSPNLWNQGAHARHNVPNCARRHTPRPAPCAANIHHFNSWRRAAALLTLSEFHFVRRSAPNPADHAAKLLYGIALTSTAPRHPNSGALHTSGGPSMPVHDNVRDSQ